MEYSPITPSGDWFFEREPGEAVDDDGDNAYDFFEDDENNYPEYVQIPLEDRKRTFSEQGSSRSMSTNYTLRLVGRPSECLS